MEITFADGVFGHTLGRDGVIRTTGLRIAWLQDSVVLRPVPTGDPRRAPDLTAATNFLSIPVSELPKVVKALHLILGEPAPTA